jgi:hypothetical protein
MSKIGVVGSILKWMRRRKREKKLRAALGWPKAIGKVEHWQIVPAEAETGSMEEMYQAEAMFEFMVNGEEFDGHVRSVAMMHHEAAVKAEGSPSVHVRYDPANPKSVAVLAEDNIGNLPFQMVAG